MCCQQRFPVVYCSLDVFQIADCKLLQATSHVDVLILSRSQESETLKQVNLCEANSGVRRCAMLNAMRGTSVTCGSSCMVLLFVSSWAMLAGVSDDTKASTHWM